MKILWEAQTNTMPFTETTKLMDEHTSYDVITRTHLGEIARRMYCDEMQDAEEAFPMFYVKIIR